MAEPIIPRPRGAAEGRPRLRPRLACRARGVGI